jgi:hypothetical protein
MDYELRHIGQRGERASYKAVCREIARNVLLSFLATENYNILRCHKQDRREVKNKIALQNLVVAIATKFLPVIKQETGEYKISNLKMYSNDKIDQSLGLNIS